MAVRERHHDGQLGHVPGVLGQQPDPSVLLMVFCKVHVNLVSKSGRIAVRLQFKVASIVVPRGEGLVVVGFDMGQGYSGELPMSPRAYASQ